MTTVAMVFFVLGVGSGIAGWLMLRMAERDLKQARYLLTKRGDVA